MSNTETKSRTTKTTGKRTIYRECSCGENAHDGESDRKWDDATKTWGPWFYFYACRNCRARIYEAK